MGRVRLSALSALAVSIGFGCSNENAVFDPSPPTLQLVVTGPCEGSNIVPLVPNALIGVDNPDEGQLNLFSARLSATGSTRGGAQLRRDV